MCTITFSNSCVSGKGEGGCLIATAAYGTELAPQVQLLRDIRDNTVLGTQSGAAFMSAFNSFYYLFSPTVADIERQSPLFKEMVKAAITPMISTLSILQFADIDSEYDMLGYGIGIILLNIGMYLSPMILVLKLGKKLAKK
ncbi:MAG: CFI-box-CTERM domain-containing protein [Nitrosopumilaceae archaeon]